MLKQALRSLSSIIPKEGPAQHFFDMTLTIELLCCLQRLYLIVSVIPREGCLAGLDPADTSQAYDHDKNLKTCFSMMQLNLNIQFGIINRRIALLSQNTLEQGQKIFGNQML